MELEKLTSTLARSFGDEFHTTYDGGKLAMAEVLADRYKVSAEQARAWIDELEQARTIYWHQEAVEMDDITDESTLRAAHIGQAPIPTEATSDEGYWQIGTP